MPIEDKIINRINQIIESGNQLRRGGNIGQQLSKEHGQKCVAWMAPAENIAQIICPNPENAYRKRINEITKQSGLMIPNKVGEFTDLLLNLLEDMNQGLLGSIVNHVRAETFDDFLDHAEVYLNSNKKEESGVIAGVVFEDTIRKICDKNAIPQNGVSIEDLINALVKADIITQIKAKRSKVCSHVRTKATHAQWDEFELADVKATIEFTRELIADKLDG